MCGIVTKVKGGVLGHSVKFPVRTGIFPCIPVTAGRTQTQLFSTNALKSLMTDGRRQCSSTQWIIEISF